MNLHRPFDVVSSSLDGEVLGVLANADAEFTAPEVHRVMGRRSVDGIRKVLERLSEQGIVIRRQAGRAYLYCFNRQHVAAGPLLELAHSRERFLEWIRATLSAWTISCEYAALFGSAARGDMSTSSDIDIFLVRPDCDIDEDAWAQQRTELAERVRNWTGNVVSVLEFGADELPVALASGDAVVLAVRDHGIRLAGPPTYLRTVNRTECA